MSKAKFSKKNKKDLSNEEEEEDEEFEVEKILEKKYNPKIKAYEYLVKWKGWGEDDSTWEPIDNLQNVLNLVNEYDKLQKKKENNTTTSASVTATRQNSAHKKSFKSTKSNQEDDNSTAQQNSKKNQAKKNGPQSKKVESEQSLHSSEEDQDKKDTAADGEQTPDELVFEKILSKRQGDDGTQYLIKFQNIKEPQWIDEVQLSAIKEDIQQFEEKQASNSKSQQLKEVKKPEHANSDAGEIEDEEEDAMKERKKKLVPPSQRATRRSQPFIEDEKKQTANRSSEKEMPKKNNISSNSNLHQPMSSSSLEQSSKVVNKLSKRSVQENGDAQAGDFQTDNIEKIEILGEYNDILSSRFEVLWKTRKDGVTPASSIYSASYLRRYEPTVLVDFMINNQNMFGSHVNSVQD